MNFCHLHCHDEYSFLDGLGSPSEYAKRAAELGHEYLAITNHGNNSGAIKHQNACSDSGIKAIIGSELYIVEDHRIKPKEEKRRHLTVLVKDDEGYESLNRLLTIGSTDGFYKRPRIDPILLKDNCSGLIIMSACSSTFLTESWGIELAYDLVGAGIPFFGEIMPHKYNEQIFVNDLTVKLSKKLGFDLLATNDCHYIMEEDDKMQEVLLAIQSKKKWKDPTRWKFDVKGLHLKSYKEMKKAFMSQGQFTHRQYVEYLNNTMLVAELCKEFSIKRKDVMLPDVPVLNGEDDSKAIRRLCESRLKELGLENNSEYKERFEHEFETISKQGFSRYFIIVWELINWCRKNDIMVGPGRGSSGGSLICYLLRITSVDPIKYNLIFARFISPARIDLPDIDMDFEDAKRPLIRKHLEELYGSENVCGVITFSTLKGRGAIRDVGRVFDVPIVDVNKASSSIVVRSGGDVRSDYTIEDAFKTFEDGKAFYKKYPEVSKIAMRIEGQTRGKGMHAAAIIISADKLTEGKRTALERGKGGDLMSCFDKHDIEHAGLMKLDVLGLNALTVLNETRKLVKRNKGIDIDFESITLDDERCFEEFSKGNNVGCFQVGSLGLRRFCQQIGVDNFMMLVHASALYRPGTLRSGMTTEFVKRKKREVEWEHKHEFLKNITDYTYGIILYQEQVMMFMYDLAGLGWKTADTVRKVISKSQGVEQFKKFKDLFIQGCKEKDTLDEETAAKIWDELASFGSYGFNLSHAVEYSVITYWDMWCKLYHPEEFICAKLTYGADDKKDEMIEEAIRLGIDIRPPKIGISHHSRWVIKDKKLYCPFIEIKGIGEKTAENFLSVDKNIGGFFVKDKKKINKKFISILEAIRADVNEPCNDEFALSITDYFSFSFIKDRKYKYRNLIKLLSDSIELSRIKNADFNKINKEYKLYFGEMTEIKFGYRAKVDTLEKKLTVAGQADNLGGVYGNFKDDTDFCMLVFGSDVYSKKKEMIEHCSGELLIAKANIPSRAGSIQCVDAWMQSDIESANLKGLGINLLKSKRYSDQELLSCNACSLIEECKRPVMPSRGKYNIMIVGEAPGKEEDLKKEGFVGRSGDLVWKELDKYDLERKMFSVTNIVKCFPSKSKTPNKNQIKKCSSLWFSKELEKINPFLILAFGNTCVNYFKGEESGIMNLSGTTEWSEKHKAWICWCIHPASVLYHRENLKLFEAGIKNFKDKIKILTDL